jgi:hypothetical protein
MVRCAGRIIELGPLRSMSVGGGVRGAAALLVKPAVASDRASCVDQVREDGTKNPAGRAVARVKFAPPTASGLVAVTFSWPPFLRQSHLPVHQHEAPTSVIPAQAGIQQYSHSRPGGSGLQAMN